jgi:hypothetical protein
MVSMTSCRVPERDMRSASMTSYMIYVSNRRRDRVSMTSSEVPAPDRKKGRSGNRTGQDRTGYHDKHHGHGCVTGNWTGSTQTLRDKGSGRFMTCIRLTHGIVEGAVAT